MDFSIGIFLNFIPVLKIYMAIYRHVHVSFWQDGFVMDLTPEEKYFYLYLMTNSKTTQCGVYELPLRIIEMDTGYNKETVEKLLNRFEEYGKIKYCKETKEILLLKWIKFHYINSTPVKNCIIREINGIKSKALKIMLYKIIQNLGLFDITSKIVLTSDKPATESNKTYGIDTVSIGYGEKEKEEEKRKNNIYKNDEEEENDIILQSDIRNISETKTKINSQTESQHTHKMQSNINQQNNAAAFYQKNISKGSISTHILSQIKTALKESGEDLVMFALQRTVENTSAPNWQYTKAILSSWKKKGITTIKQADEERKQKNKNPSSTSDGTSKNQNSSYNQNSKDQVYKNSKNKFMNFKQTPYDWEEIERMEMERTMKEIKLLQESKI